MAFKDNIFPQNSDKISSLNDRPNAPEQYGGNSLSADSLKAKFDVLPNMAIAKLNEIITAYNNGEFAKSLPINGGTYTTLQAFENAVKSGDLAKNIAVTSVDKADTEEKEALGTLQDVLTYLTAYISALNTAKGDGALADEMTVDTYNGASTLQAVLTVLTDFVTQLNADVSNGTLAVNLKVGEVTEAGVGDGDKVTNETFDTLQDVLTYLANYIKNLETGIGDKGLSARLAIRDIAEGNADYPNGIKTLDALVKAITDGTLSQFLTVMLYNESGTKKPLTEVFFMIDEIDKEVKRIEEEVNSKTNGTLYRYKGTRTSLPDPTNGDELEEGYVYNIVTENGEPFIYNGVSYPSGTNMAYIGNEEWDALGGLVDLSGGSEWDLIITDPADLSKLSTASGNVLVKLSEPYESTLTITLGENLKLLDFGGSVISRVDLTATSGAYTTVRNINRKNFYHSYFKYFNLVDNINCYAEVSWCNEVKNTQIVRANNCSGIHNCTIIPDTDGDTLITNCQQISNVDVYSIEESGFTGSVEFTNCHHISNVHCVENENHEDEGNSLAYLIHYIDCKFVDPFTCAGYLNDDGDEGRIYYPKWDGSVWCTDFKVDEVATKDDIGNIENALRILNEGSVT